MLDLNSRRASTSSHATLGLLTEGPRKPDIPVSDRLAASTDRMPLAVSLFSPQEETRVPYLGVQASRLARWIRRMLSMAVKPLYLYFAPFLPPNEFGGFLEILS